MADDLSRTIPGLVPSSMAATNTISDSTAMTAPGTASESTSGEQAGDPETSERDAARGDWRRLSHGEPGGEAGYTWDDVSGRRQQWGR